MDDTPQLTIIESNTADDISTICLPLSPEEKELPIIPPSKTILIKSQSFDSACPVHTYKRRTFRHRESPYKSTSPSDSYSPISMSLSLANLNLSNKSSSRVRRSSSSSSTSSHRSSASSISSLRTLFTNIKTKMHKNGNSCNDITDRTCTVVETKRIKSKWRPQIHFIYDDTELLNILIEFMRKQYNEENILFLQSVYKLKENINNLLKLNSEINIVQQEKINVEITNIYNKYIKTNALKQINLSSECWKNMMYIYQKFTQLDLNAKKDMFNLCVNEIEYLVHTSILNDFYLSETFQLVARTRCIYRNSDMFNQQRLFKNSNSNEHKNEFFDCYSSVNWNDKNKFILSSNGYRNGSYEWTIKIINCNQMRQEFGIVSNLNTKIEMNESGLTSTPEFGARAMYGFVNNSFYYCSCNSNNKLRCNKNLSQLKIHTKNGHFCKGDLIKICLNLDKGNIKFYLNGKQVRKSVSIETNTIYYPIVVYSGQCKYTTANI